MGYPCLFKMLTPMRERRTATIVPSIQITRRFLLVGYPCLFTELPARSTMLTPGLSMRRRMTATIVIWMDGTRCFLLVGYMLTPGLSMKRTATIVMWIWTVQDVFCWSGTPSYLLNYLLVQQG